MLDTAVTSIRLNMLEPAFHCPESIRPEETPDHVLFYYIRFEKERIEMEKATYSGLPPENIVPPMLEPRGAWKQATD